MPKFYYTYVLQSLKDKELYIGWTKDLRERFKKHNNGEVEATKNRAPLKLIYYEACLSKESAIKREKSLKTGFGRSYIKERVNKVNIPV
ncbi:MAG: excinuclease ABC subunit C [Candidatus Levybacteria bacterium RIFCSPHIGHO2_01_FULL_36_15]|nr:MAG: excinuclease ABC subunit C [Candidatus Levybacteria bacterium RIFCSPHIGHO2_01_FULL_36_15]OGH37296.1 MAG: excinuclease ABC subunit C [Candidatus Levybacteria bacterium RIFCSPLOWO2_01_FULL_36_10]